MAGHSKWANIKHRKESSDKKKGRLFAKLSREIMVSARLGGPDPNANPRLRIAISKARSSNMPQENIEKAIKKGIGELQNSNYEEIVYEAFAPGGVGLLIEVMTDKKTRTTPEIKNILSKANASMSTPNSVLKFFERKGIIIIPKDQIEEEKLYEIAIENGAEDLKIEEDAFIIITDPKDFSNVNEILNHLRIKIEEANIKFIPLEGTEVRVDLEKAQKILKLIETLENHDEVQAVYHNLFLSEEIEKVLS